MKFEVAVVGVVADHINNLGALIREDQPKDKLGQPVRWWWVEPRLFAKRSIRSFRRFVAINYRLTPLLNSNLIG